jgi:hypothetical protein
LYSPLTVSLRGPGISLDTYFPTLLIYLLLTKYETSFHSHTKEHAKLLVSIIKIRRIYFFKVLAILPKKYVLLFAWWHQVLDLQASLTEAIKKNEKFKKVLSQKQLDIEEMDSVICKLQKRLKAHDDLIGSLNRLQQKQDQCIATLQSTMDERETHSKKVFKHNDLTLCIKKYFYIFGLFTDSKKNVMLLFKLE